METQWVEYTYDVMDRRIAKSVDSDGDTSTTAITTRFVYDGDNVLLEFDGSSSSVPSTRYLHGPNVDQVLAQESGSNTVWHLADHLGTIHDLVDNSGTVVNHYTYDSFGNVVDSMADATVDTRYKFTGREFDAETGMHYYRARYYDAGVGRFIGQDPIGFEGDGANLYTYAVNRPVHYTDPLGLYVRVGLQTRTISYRDRGGKTARSIQEVARARLANPNVYVQSDVTVAWLLHSNSRHGSGTSSNNSKLIPDMKTGDAQGHIIAAQLGGSGSDLKNLFPQNHRLSNNRNPWKGFENEVRREIESTRLSPPQCRGVVKYIVRLRYPSPRGGSSLNSVISQKTLRPKTIEAQALVYRGIQYSKTIFPKDRLIKNP